RRSGSAAPAVALDAARAATGGRLFAELGCIGCHTRPDRAESGAAEPDGRAPRIPLRRVAFKWQPAALVRLLMKPTADARWLRMPDLHLAEAEATALASFLITRSAANPAPPTPAGGDAQRGEELYAKLECRRCHEPEAARAALPPSAAPKLSALAKS